MAQKKMQDDSFQLAIGETKPVNLRTWLDEHGVPFERVEKCTVLGGTRTELMSSRVDGSVRHVDFPGWTFDLTVVERGGVTAFAVRLSDEEQQKGGAITARQLRKVRIADLALALRAAASVNLEAAGMPSHLLPLRLQEDTGPRPVTDHRLATAMAHYIDAASQGFASEEAARRVGISLATMNRYRSLAIRRGLFKSHGRGKPGGVLTPAGEAALEEGDE